MQEGENGNEMEEDEPKPPKRFGNVRFEDVDMTDEEFLEQFEAHRSREHGVPYWKDEEEDDENGVMKLEDIPMRQSLDYDSDSVGDLEAFGSNNDYDLFGIFRREANNMAARKGSDLHRNTKRRRHLHRLFLKRQIRQKVVVDDASEGDDDASEVFPTRARAMSQEVKARARRMSQEVAELLEEVEQGEEIEQLSAKLRELHALVKPYSVPDGPKLLGQYPLEVRLQNVTYTVDAPEKVENSGVPKIKTVFSASLVYKLYQWLLRASKVQEEPSEKPDTPRESILKNINLVIKPGKQYLVLGPPGSGKSTLLKAIAGQLQYDEKRNIEGGEITYNGTSVKAMDGMNIENAFGYIDQLDKHAALLTVGETLEFAFQCKSGGKILRERKGLSPKQLELIRKAQGDGLSRKLMLCILGLTEVEDTFVGDENVRGVSGGQRRRVTVGEMLMSRTPVVCGDEISTGLDAASTYDMVETLLHIGRGSNFSRIFALLQPSPEVVSLFDEVIVLAEGYIIYAGRIEEVEDYFANIGFKSPEFIDVADFLQMVSTKDRATLYDPTGELKETRPKVPNIPELAEIFQLSKQGQRIQHFLSSPNEYVFKKENKQTILKSKGSGNVLQLEAVRQKFANQGYRSLELITKRFLTLWARDKKVLAFSILRNVINGASVGGAFFNADNFISIQGAMFQTGIFVLLGSLQTSPGLIADRVLFYKHSDANFYSAWPYVFGRALSQVPQTFLLDTLVSGSTLYFLIGLADRASASNFFTYLGILFTFAMLMNQQMAVFASFASQSQLQVCGAVTLFFFILFGGYIIPIGTLPFYFYWIYWINPFTWAYNAMILNEVYSGRWDRPDLILRANGFLRPDGTPFSDEWVHWSFIYMILYFLVCCFLTALGLTYVRNTGEVISQKKKEVQIEDEENGDALQMRIGLPFKPLTLSFRNLGYEVTHSITKEKLMLLENVNGIFRPSRMCALMGSSGAGKTTLMDVIALRKRSGKITGEVFLNGFKQDPISFRRCSGYVEQFDVQSPELTVRETVLFSARLRLDVRAVGTDDQVVAFVDQIIEDVELSDLSGSLVGSGVGAGLSFEQKKRLSIAVELAASPSILFLDEPTSGLDARSALLVVRLLRKICNSGRTIVATIHQPSSTVFEMFDDLLLLKKGGRVAYHGALGNNSRTLIDYFESRGAPQIELGDNPANWILRVMQDESVGDPVEIYEESVIYASMKKELESLVDSPDLETKIEFEREFAASKTTRQYLTNKRLRTIYWRSPTYNLGRLMVSLIMACLLGSVFILERHKTTYTEADIRARISVIFFSNIILGIMSILSVLPVMTWIRDMFYRHRDAGMYDSASIGVALGTAESAFICISSGLFCVVFLASSGIGFGVERLVGFWGFFTFNSALFSYFGQLFVSTVKSLKTATILCGIYIGINNLFAGLIIPPQEMTTGFYSITYYITPGHYIFEGEITALMYNDLRKVKALDDGDFYQWLVNRGTCMDGQVDPCVGTQEEYVKYFFGGEFTEDNTARNVIILGIVLFIARFFTWVALKYIRFSQ